MYKLFSVVSHWVFKVMKYFLKFKIANETADKWSKLSPDDRVSLEEEFFAMTFKGMTRSCLGDVFADDEEIQQLRDAYDKVCLVHPSLLGCF